MAESSNEVDLETFLKSAGQSFSDAQKALLPGMDVSVNMMLNNVELELKVAVNTDALGKITIRPISSADINGGGIDPGMLSTIRINFVSSIGEVTAPPRTTPTPGGGGVSDTVPDLVGLTLNEAASLLKSRGWAFEPHAAGVEEIKTSGEEMRGKIIRQQPYSAEPADKSTTTVQLWIDLGNMPVQEIDGIGYKTGENLLKIGIRSIGELSLAGVSQIASLLRINETRARGLVDMAALMSRLAVLGFKDEVVEVLVKGAGIRTVGELAKSDPEELFHICSEAVSAGKVQVPRDFSFNLKDVGGWIKSAKG